ncbi:hypothetical protein A4R26_04355 [Niastella populi]|uniref:F5/8 type C domain-containing protein n=2 Tax=Niastella populi TaxID=550983 RepID=A0A1V9FDL5_9BACT|nr:hypothetical protein A4R26_04355 [Niastella populi]
MTVLFSCKKDDAADIKGNAETMFFTNNTNLGNMPGNSLSYSVVNIPDAASTGWLNLSSGLPGTIKIPLYATNPVRRDVTVTAEPDNSLVAVYNAANNTNYAQLPAGILTTQSLTAKIMEGQTTSVDSFSIGVNPADLNTLTAPAYMVPIKLTTVSDPSIGSITSNTTIKVVYVVLNIELRRIRYNATAADVTGTLQSKASWMVNFNPAPNTAGNILDGVTSTYSRWGGSPVQVDLDMQAAKNVTGFRLYSTTSSTNIPTQMEVSVSNDGINYELLGSPLRANLNYASGYNYVLFYKPITARYLRLKVSYGTSTSSNNFRIAELDVYAN